MSMEHLSINVVDIGASLIICLSTLRGFHRGLSGELSQLISVACALILGVYARAPLGSWIAENTKLSGRSAHALAFAAVVLAVILAMVMLGFVFRRIMKVVFEENVDKPGGGLAGLVSGTIFVIIIFMIMNMWPHEYLNRQFGEESVIGRVVIKWTPATRGNHDEAPARRDEEGKMRKGRGL